MLPQELDTRLKAAGAAYYVRRPDMLAVGNGADRSADDECLLARFVTSFATTEQEIESFAGLIQKG
jgi:hypothetical protein